MSLTTWIDEFYPLSAVELASDPDTTATDAIKHSLRKWKGLLLKNTSKHVLINNGMDLIGHNATDTFPIDDESCSLCQMYDCTSDHNHDEYKLESPCPLWVNDIGCNSKGSAWIHFTKTDDPVPMIKALKKVLKLEKKNEHSKL